MSEVEVLSPQQVRWNDMDLADKLAVVNQLLPHDIRNLISPDMSGERLAAGMREAAAVSKKGALWWGQMYRMGVEIHGQEFYQYIEDLYKESTLKNYERLTHQVHPELWPEDVPDRHFQAIGQTLDSLEEQRAWVEHYKKQRSLGNEITGDGLRRRIHRWLEMKGRRRPVTATWHECRHCHGRGGWMEEKPNDG